MKVFLDDERNHHEDGWVQVRTVPALMRLIAAQGHRITRISFDNDLQQPEEGWMAVRDIVDRIAAGEGRLLPELEAVYVHSLNGGAAENMLGRLRNAVRVGLLDAVVERRPAYDGIYPLDSEDPRTVEVYD